MAEIIEKRVSFEVAELLKQKGFDEWCTAFYVKKGKNVILQECDNSVCFEECHNTTLEEYNSKNEYNVSAPTIQMAIEWLMLNHNMYFSFLPVFVNDKLNSYKISVYRTTENEFKLSYCCFVKGGLWQGVNLTLKNCLKMYV